MTTSIKMLRGPAVWTLGLIVGLLFVLAEADRSVAEEQLTVKGEIVDLACYLSNDSRGPEHRACARRCAKKGMPLGVLTEAGDVYLLIEDHDDPDPYADAKKLAGDQAEIRGTKFSKGGVASILVFHAKGL